MEDEDNIFDILKNPARICEMDIDLTYFLLEKCASLLEESFFFFFLDQFIFRYYRLEVQSGRSTCATTFKRRFVCKKGPPPKSGSTSKETKRL